MIIVNLPNGGPGSHPGMGQRRSRPIFQRLFAQTILVCTFLICSFLESGLLQNGDKSIENRCRGPVVRGRRGLEALRR